MILFAKPRSFGKNLLQNNRTASLNFKNDFLKRLFQKSGGIKLGIGRVAEAFSSVFNKKIGLYHVAGTNGKGTAVYALDEILRFNGLKTGRFISPHLLDYNERISINGQNIKDDEVADIFNFLSKKLSNFNELSFFEITFLIAWVYFEENGCERVLFEVGLGGRLDATNVLNYPKTDVVTSIGFDHTRILGDTLEKIALEKLGIVKRGDRVLIGSSDNKKFDEWMAEIAFSKGALIVKDEKLLIPAAIKRENLSFEQIKNIKLAINAAILTEKEAKIPDFSSLVLPARFEYIAPNVILDVAHNPPAIKSLVEMVKLKNKTRKTAVLYGAMRDKDIAKSLDLIGEITDSIFIITLEADNRGAKISELCERASDKIKPKLKFAKTDEETMSQALDFVDKNGRYLVVCGSFHTIEKFVNFQRNRLKN